MLLNVTVTDRMNRLVTGLRKEHFQVKEDKVPQEITQFGEQDSPLSAGLVFDSSGSMGHKMAKARESVARFFSTANPQDEFFLVQFSHRPKLVTSFTHDTAAIQNKLVYTESKGRTSLLDAVYLAVSNMRRASNPRKAIIVVSDGGDNTSRYTERELKRLVKEADVQIYAIGIFEPLSGRVTPEELYGPRLLANICEITGGRGYAVEDLDDLPDVVETISMELRNQYVIGYVPTNQERDGKWRRLRLELKKVGGLSHLRPRSRLGYYAPSR